jgi:hypothetical protein
MRGHYYICFFTTSISNIFDFQTNLTKNKMKSILKALQITWMAVALSTGLQAQNKPTAKKATAPAGSSAPTGSLSRF